MKKIITLIVYSYLCLGVAACKPPDESNLDPRHVEQNVYEKKIRDLSKSYAKLYVRHYDPEKSFDLFLSFFLMVSNNAYTKENCAQAIEDGFKNYKLVFFKADAKKKLQSYCDYDTENLMALGDQYLKKSQGFDYNTLTAMHFYYNAYIRTTREYLDDDYNHIPYVIELSRESYNKFINLREQFPDISYITVSTDTPFDQDDSE